MLALSLCLVDLKRWLLELHEESCCKNVVVNVPSFGSAGSRTRMGSKTSAGNKWAWNRNKWKDSDEDRCSKTERVREGVI